MGEISEAETVAASAKQSAQAKALSAPDELPAGFVVDDYTILSKLGSGGCASVYLAASVTGTKVALKCIRREWVNSDEMLRRFMYEVRAANTIKHPNIVEVLDSGLLPDGRPYFTMEYLAGMTLLGYASLHGRFHPRDALLLLEPIASALGAAHAAGIIHRDLKGGNIMVMPNSHPRVVKLLDFGIAKFLYPEDNTPALTRLGARLGTPSTMSPEQLRGEVVDNRSDIYALGILLYRLLVGRHPFESHDVTEVERMHLEQPPPRPSGYTAVSPAVDAVVLRCLEKDRERRFQTVEELIEALKTAVETESGPAAGAVAEVPAVGLYVEARLLTEETDDPLLNDFAAALDIAETSLRSAKLQLPLVTGNAMLAVTPLGQTDSDRHVQYQNVLAAATSLFDLLEKRPTRDERVHVNVSVHYDRVELRNWSEVTGGALAQVAEWAPQTEVQGVFVSQACRQALPPTIATQFEEQLRSRTK